MSRRHIRIRGRRQSSIWYKVGFIIGQALQEAISEELKAHSPTHEQQDISIKYDEEGKQ